MERKPKAVRQPYCIMEQAEKVGPVYMEQARGDGKLTRKLTSYHLVLAKKLENIYPLDCRSSIVSLILWISHIAFYKNQ